MNKESASKDSEIRVERIDLPISGMTCSSCATKIEKVLASSLGVSKATVNSILIPVAAGALYPSFGILLNPILAEGAMAFSSVTVVSNALRLRKFKPPMISKRNERVLREADR